MRNLIFLGIVFLAIGLTLFFLNNRVWDLRALYGALSGIGVGLIFGGITGYISKGSAVKRERKNREIKKLQQEKEALEREQKKLLDAQARQELQNQEREPNL